MERFLVVRRERVTTGGACRLAVALPRRFTE
jgi:hypothetical protein